MKFMLQNKDKDLLGIYQCGYNPFCVSLLTDRHLKVRCRTDFVPGGGTSYVGQYGMLGYTWVIFEKFSVLFPRDGYLFSTKFLYFFCKVGIYFEENSVFVEQDGTHLQEIFCILFHKVAAFTHKNFCIFLHDEYLFKRFTVVAGTVVFGTN